MKNARREPGIFTTDTRRKPAAPEDVRRLLRSGRSGFDSLLGGSLVGSLLRGRRRGGGGRRSGVGSERASGEQGGSDQGGQELRHFQITFRELESPARRGMARLKTFLLVEWLTRPT